jgi:DNA polymerase elongation subunit (family B)
MRHTANILLLDIETAPNVAFTWGLFKQNISLGQLVKPGRTICWAAKWLDKKKVIYKSEYHQDHETMVREMWKLLDEADLVIHYNGKKFDIPTLNKEFVLLGMGPPSPYRQIDLINTCRSQFRFASNKLDFICQQLGLGGKVQHKGMALWVGCMEGRKSDWKMMKEYNIEDVHLLERLYFRLLPWITTHPNLAMFMDTDRPVCTNCVSSRVQSRGTEVTNRATYRRFKCMGCGANLKGRTPVKGARKPVLV